MRTSLCFVIVCAMMGCSSGDAATDSVATDAGDDTSATVDAFVDSATNDTATTDTATDSTVTDTAVDDTHVADTTSTDGPADTSSSSDSAFDGGGGTQVTQLAAGGGHTCAIKTDGTLWCWGTNDRGQLGSDLGNDHHTPIQIAEIGTAAKQVSAGYNFSCALKTDGTVWCWGAGNIGQLGDGLGTDSTAPVQVTALGTNVASVVSDHDGLHSCAIETDGSVWCWGGNAYGQIGNGTITNALSPVHVTAFGADAGAPTFVAVTASFGVTCARGSDASLWCWGSNSEGQVGTGNNTGPNMCSGYACANTPYRVTELGGTVKGVANGDLHTCAIEGDDSLWCVGLDTNHELGVVEDAGLSFSPLHVTTLAGAVKAVAAGSEHTCAIETDGSLWCWGDNNAGQVGVGTTEAGSTVDVPVPTKVLDSVLAVTAGINHTCAIDASRQAWCWGFNVGGRLGDGTTTTRPTPVAVVW